MRSAFRFIERSHMKASIQKIVFPLLLFIAVGTSAVALETKGADVATKGTGTALENVKITLKAPLYSPLFSRFPVAVVNGEQISLESIRNSLASAHESREEGKLTGKLDFAKMLDRLITVKIISQEAMNIGLDEGFEYKKMMDDYSSQLLAGLLKADVTRDVTADPLTVEKLYKESVLEWKIKSLVFENESDAQTMIDALKAGKSFDELAEKALADKKARGGQQGEYIKPKELLPHIAQTLSTMETGSVSPVIKPVPEQKEQGFIILKLEDKTYRDDPEARQAAQDTVLGMKKREMMEQFLRSSFKQNVTIKKRRIDNLDYDSAKVDFAKLLADTKVLAEIEGVEPVTVGDLTEALKAKFYHGLKAAAEGAKINNAKDEVMNDLLNKRLLRREQLKRGIDKSEEYEKRLSEYRDSVLFGMFIQKEVIPHVKLSQDEIKAYFEEHKDDYVYPEMLKMTSLVFTNKSDAETALVKLRKGTDINWVRTNAAGLADKKDAEDLFFQGSTVIARNLPGDMYRAILGAKRGEYRLYEAPAGRYCVLSIQDVIPARQQSLEEVADAVTKKVFDQSVNRSVQDWDQKLRANAEIEIYLADGEK